MSPDHDPRPDGPRERLRDLGADALSDIELLALILGTGQRGEPVLALAARLLGAFGGAPGMLRAGVGELAAVVGPARAARIVGALSLVRRGLAQPLDPRAPCSSSRDVALAFAPRFGDRREECVIAVVLDGRQRPIAERHLATGGPVSCSLSVRQVFALAVREGGAAVLLVHNHPSGDPRPSPDDVALTKALADAGRALELPLLDHVIVGRHGSFSFLDAGLLDPGSIMNDTVSVRTVDAA